MKMRNIFSLFLTGGITVSAALHAQCPAMLQLSVGNKSDAPCPSSGSATIHSNAPVGSLTYTIIAGPLGAPVNMPQGDSVFNALPAGNYTVKATCNANTSVNDVMGFTILNQYTKIDTAYTTLTTGSCGTGTINITGVTGGRLPLMYSVIKNTDPNYSDVLSAYGTATSFASLTTGVYQVRVKDNCNQLFTKTIEILPALPGVGLNLFAIEGQSCASTKYDITILNTVDPVTGNATDVDAYLNAGGLTLKVYDGGIDCSKGALLSAFNYTTASGTGFQINKLPGKLYYLEVITPCGVVTHQCIDMTNFKSELNLSATTTGCNTVPSPARMGILPTYEFQVKYPVTVTVMNGSGVPITGSPFTLNNTSDWTTKLSNLVPDNYHVVVNDKCGAVIQDVVITNITGVAPSAATASAYLSCADQLGAASPGVFLNGYIPNLRNADSVEIISGPSNVGVNGVNWPVGSNLYSWNNMLPGMYVIRVFTPCGYTNVNYDLVGGAGFGLQRSIQTKATSYCGGTGKVEIDAPNTTYNGSGTMYYVLVNSMTNARIDSNTTGVYTNIGAGNYKINMVVEDYCDADSRYEVSSNTVTIVAASDKPKITKKLGMICEDENGNLLASGTAYLELAGGNPLVLEFKKETDATYTTFKTSASATESIAGLVPYTIYDIRVTSCGQSQGEKVTIGKLDPVRRTNFYNPCANEAYTLAVPEMPGATYVWKNGLGVVVSNAFNYIIPNYIASFDGNYTCTIKFGNCVTKTVTQPLSSMLCGISLPLNLLSFNAVRNGAAVMLTWKTTEEKGTAYFDVQRGTNGKDYATVGTVSAAQAAQAVNLYHFNDLNTPSCNLYYRLRMVDADGSFRYSGVKVLNNGQANASGIVIAPNPVAKGQSLTVVADGAAMNGTYRLMNITGQMVQQGAITVAEHAGITATIATQSLPAGMYLLVIVAEDCSVYTREKVSVQ